MEKLTLKADQLRDSVMAANNVWDDFKTEFERAGLDEREFPKIKELQKWLLRANSHAEELCQHISVS
jgi:hypothetical protein